MSKQPIDMADVGFKRYPGSSWKETAQILRVAIERTAHEYAEEKERADLIGLELMRTREALENAQATIAELKKEN